MKPQTWIIVTLVFALLIAIFAVINVDPVQVDFLFTTTESPLILVILLSALLGALSIASLSYVKYYQMRREIRELKEENQRHKDETPHLSDEQDETPVDGGNEDDEPKPNL